MTKASARHIPLVATEAECLKLKSRLKAERISPRSPRPTPHARPEKRGGELGEFTRGQMVPEFDQVVFTKEVNKAWSGQDPVRLSSGRDHQAC